MPRPSTSSSSAVAGLVGGASSLDLPSNCGDPSRKQHHSQHQQPLQHSSPSVAPTASAAASSAESKSNRHHHHQTLALSPPSSSTRHAGVIRTVAATASGSSLPPLPGLLSPGSIGNRSGMLLSASGTTARTAARDNDLLASVDELKEYKDEGDADAENKSSAENLDEEKRGLLTETEQVYKACFRLKRVQSLMRKLLMNGP